MKTWQKHINKNSPHQWHHIPRWKRRLFGFVCYQICSVLALFIPEHTDREVQRSLNDQFRGQ